MGFGAAIKMKPLWLYKGYVGMEGDKHKPYSHRPATVYGGGVPRGMEKNTETTEVCLTGKNASFGGYTSST